MRGLWWAVLLSIGLLASEAARADEIQPFGRGSYAALLRQFSGRPVVVHFWSRTCAPCLAEMPFWRDLARRRSDLNLVLVSTDPIQEAPGLGARLKRFGLDHLPLYAFADSNQDRLLFEVDRKWRGELPYTVLAGKDGRSESVLGTVDEAVMTGWLDRQ